MVRYCERPRFIEMKTNYKLVQASLARWKFCSKNYYEITQSSGHTGIITEITTCVVWVFSDAYTWIHIAKYYNIHGNFDCNLGMWFSFTKFRSNFYYYIPLV